MMFTRMARIAGVLLALAGGVAVSACNTIEGAGKDVERAARRFRTPRRT